MLEEGGSRRSLVPFRPYPVGTSAWGEGKDEEEHGKSIGCCPAIGSKYLV